MNDFHKAHIFTAEFEGGYVNDPLDSGGETNLGVTARVWRAWCKAQGLPVKPMRALTLNDVLPLYETWYWDDVQHLPWPLSGVAYDINVNHGTGNMRWMLGQIDQGQPPERQAASLIDVREKFYRDIVRRRPTQIRFLRGWLRRASEQRKWLAAQHLPGVVYVDRNGAEVRWDGRPAYYGGVRVDHELLSTLRLVYPAPGGPWEYSGLKVWRRRNGDFVLERGTS